MGLQGLHDTGLMGIVKCHIRLLDSFGTEAICKYLKYDTRKCILRYI